MKKDYILYFAAAFLFAVAAILSFINQSNYRGTIALIFFLVMLLTAINRRKKSKII
jgi:hypothetical protein